MGVETALFADEQAKTMAETKPFLLTVLSGPNAGASARFAPGKLSIGGGAGDQIILAGVAPGCLALRASAAHLRLVAKVEGLRLDEGGLGELHELPPEHPVEIALPVTLQLNDETAILLTQPGAVARAGISLQAGVGIFALTLAAGLWLGAEFGGGAARPTLMPLAQAEAATLTPEAPKTALPTRLAATSPRLVCGPDCVSEATAALAARLGEAGLSGLHLTSEAGVLRVRGTLSRDQAESWRQIRARFESDHGQSLPLISEIAEGQPAPVLAVASVWLGARPELRTKSGTVLRIGDMTNDGWRIEAISRSEIALARGDERLAVRF
ncbi:SctD/MshK family protein [Paracoccus aminophilus]|uniref:Uncharacterized protein n=1 Tax=Paracoccus aminophilus JCM 7686 TaxID=1367847 RepID=S5XZJ8_PARAH|nr:hypothetical protein [Paracoccus aminophilus]AGT08870.1 hypothetical protein JCM7686_1769 [Paracoccus aminophilus JCM 7686]